MQRHARDRTAWAVTPIALAPLLLALGVLEKAHVPASPARPEPAALAALEARSAVLGHRLARAQAFWDGEVRPVEAVLRPYHPDARWVRTVAWALVTEGQRAGVDPRVLAAVVLVENPWLDPEARSDQGAIGLMQVMPFHAGQWPCDSEDLTDPVANVCHGARVLRRLLARADGDLERALLAYNGCVRGTNTADCHLYPSHVFSRAGRAALRGWMGGE